MKRTLDPKKIVVEGSARDQLGNKELLFIGYTGVGGSAIPTSMFNKLAVDSAYKRKIYNAILEDKLTLVLIEAVKHSQYIPFEEIKMSKP